MLLGLVSAARSRLHSVLPAVLVAALLAIYAVAARPIELPPGEVPGADGANYAYGALSLLQGQYLVERRGVPQMPRQSPGLSILLMPFVALGGVDSAVWLSYGAGLALGIAAALVAARLGGPLAAPLAVATVLFAAAPVHFARLVMSDLPSATLAMLEVALLALGSGRVTAVGAGLLAGALVWVRPAAALLVLAGLAGATAARDWRARAAWYLVGAAPLLALLGAWQLVAFGSPLTTTYQAAGFALAGAEADRTFFSLQYVVGPPWGADGPSLGGSAEAWGLPSIVLYPLQLVGADAFLSLPGVGLLGLVGLLRFWGREGAPGVVGRFGLVAIAATLVVYVPFFYQSARFLMLPASLLGVVAAALLARGVAGLGQYLERRRRSAAAAP
ncbi:MAG: hypothetical protein HY690_07405 [Chloroflexi bacterium]|nr:hypothetical protein [Chloroflexota bacterium]